MKANELMIGDWVEVPFLEGKPKIVKVEEILFDEINPEWDGMENYGGIKIKYVEPIPLTPEILEKNGFVLEDYSGDFMSGKWWTRDDFVIPENMIDSVGRNNFNYNYVHELQHALKLCGIEKTIEL